MPSRDFNPKDGKYVQVMNEFIDALTKYRLDSNEWSLLMLIMRNSWGIKGQAWARLRWKFIKEKTCLSESSLTYARRKMIARNFIHTRKNGQLTEYKINSKYETWIPEGEIPVFRKYYKAILGHSSDLINLGHSSDLKQVTPVTQLGHSSDLVPIKDNIKNKGKDTPIVPIEIPPAPTTENGEPGSTVVLTKKQIIEQEAKTVIDYMNNLSGKTFKHSETSLSKVRARLRDGYTLEQCLTVCLNKWLDKDHKEKYYRPVTLFRPSLFEGYVNEKGTKRKPKMNTKVQENYELFARRHHARQQQTPGSD